MKSLAGLAAEEIFQRLQIMICLGRMGMGERMGNFDKRFENGFFNK